MTDLDPTRTGIAELQQERTNPETPLYRYEELTQELGELVCRIVWRGYDGSEA